VLEEDKHYLFENSLAPIVKQLGLGSINDLCKLLQASQHANIRHQVVEAITTNETYFFRDPCLYEAIQSVLLPRLIEERSNTKELRVRSAAASTGQEAYNLAMLLIEAGFNNWNIQILGNDFSPQVLERAWSGRHQQIDENRESPALMLAKHFHHSGVDWQLNNTVRRMVGFGKIDLRNSMSALGPFDLVFCRNVMIYFDAETKKSILKELHGIIFRSGWLWWEA
jgi:chemotaxis protein methyltransferase CheR